MLCLGIVFHSFIPLFLRPHCHHLQSPLCWWSYWYLWAQTGQTIHGQLGFFLFCKGFSPFNTKGIHISSEPLPPFLFSQQSSATFPIGNIFKSVCHRLGNSSLKHQTIKCYLSGVRHLQISAGLPDPFTLPMPHLKLVLRGIKHHQSEIGSTAKARLPITPQILRSLNEYWLSDNQGDDTLMIWAACCLCFFGFLRAGEICTPSNAIFDPGCHLSPADISIDDPSHPSILRICIKQSKTDPFRKGVHIIVGATGDCLCPVAAVLQIGGSSQVPYFVFPMEVLSPDRILSLQFVEPYQA